MGEPLFDDLGALFYDFETWDTGVHPLQPISRPCSIEKSISSRMATRYTRILDAGGLKNKYFVSHGSEKIVDFGSKVQGFTVLAFSMSGKSTRIKDAGIAIRHSRGRILFYTVSSRNELEGPVAL